MEYLVSEAVPAFGTGDALSIAGLTEPPQSVNERYASLTACFQVLLSGPGGPVKSAVIVWDDKAHNWVRHSGDGHDHAASIEPAASLPFSVLNHAAKTGQALLLIDPASDAQLGQDEYLQTTRPCSLMAVPVSQHGVVRAFLLFETSTASGVFTKEHLHAVTSICEQLESSAEHLRLCERLKFKVQQQAALAEETRLQFAKQAQRGDMAEIADNALHNVANLLTSVNTSVHVMSTKLRELPASRLSELARLLSQPVLDLQSFFAPSGKGRLIPSYLSDLANVFSAEREQIVTELRRLRLSVDHMTNIVTVQQSYSRAGGMIETLSVGDVIDDALRMQAAWMVRRGVQVVREFGDVAPMSLDKTRVMQILVNLVENATEAMEGMQGEHCIHIGLRQEGDSVFISVRDNGCGIAPENLGRSFSHSFTTKIHGHGFGLHSCAIAAREMRGDLTVHNDNPQKRATNDMRLPYRAV